MTIEKLQQTETLDSTTQELLDDPQAFDVFLRDLEELYPDEAAAYNKTQDRARTLYDTQLSGVRSWYSNERELVSDTSHVLAWAKLEENRLKRNTLAHNSNTVDA